MKYESTILIVDDQLSAREVLRGTLTNQGYNLAFAGSGEEALAQAADLTPDLILLDVMMPDMTGIEVCQRLRADSLLAEVPVIMVTALDDHSSLIQGIEAGADDFISKPFNHAELKARVRNIIRIARYRRLLAGRSKFEWVVEQARDGYIVLDPDHNILYANRQARLYLDLPPTDSSPLPAEPFLELIQRQYNLEPEQAWATWPQKNQAPRYLVYPESTTAAAFWLEVNVQALPAGPEGEWIIQLQDVTSQLEMQRNAWQFQALVAHKLRTPMVALLSGLSLLEEENVAQELPSDMARLFELVFQSSRRLDRDIQDILQHVTTPVLVQPEAGFDLSQLQPILAQLSAELELEPVTLAHKADVNNHRIPLTEQALELILREILENAKKFHPNQVPKIEISTYLLDGDRQVCLEISDNGLTLSPEQLAQIWIPYYQGEKYFTGQIAGMGLGLSSVALLMWSVGGTCRIYNRQDGPGLTVELILPLSQQSDE